MDFNIDTVLDIGSDEFYRASRYQIPLSVILVNSNDKNVFDVIEKNLRKTDMIQQLSSELIVVFLAHTGYDDAIAFIDKVKNSVEFTSTVGEYKGFRNDFIKKLFLENESKNFK